jgi:hypothetical protein
VKPPTDVGFLKWGYPISWMVENPIEMIEMDEI